MPSNPRRPKQIGVLLAIIRFVASPFTMILDAFNKARSGKLDISQGRVVLRCWPRATAAYPIAILA